MWGIALRPRAAQPLALAGLLLLTACATHHPAPQASTVTPVPATGERDATGAYRFNMTQNGRRMTADEFDAWMKARGIRVAKGAPAKAEPARASAQAKTPAKTARPKATVASANPAVPAKASANKAPAPAKPAAVAQAKPKAKLKPVAKEVSEAKAPVKQGSGEG